MISPLMESLISGKGGLTVHIMKKKICPNPLGLFHPLV